MKKYVIAAALLILGGIAGCATVAKTGEENLQNYGRIVELESRQMADDFNMIWFADRASRLNRYSMR
jgi:hypothetical protein